MGLKSSEYEFNTEKSVHDIGSALQSILRQAKTKSIREIKSTSGAWSAFDERGDIEIVAECLTVLSGQWVVQVAVFDRDLYREIRLGALGDGAFTRAIGGAARTASLSTSVKKRDEIAAALQ
jgi:hypothetical protein